VQEPFSKETADKVQTIGGTDLSRVPEDLFIKDMSNFHFAAQQSVKNEDRKICLGGISGFLKPADTNFLYVFRVLNVLEGERPAFAALTAEQKTGAKKDYLDQKVKEEAYKQLFTHQELDAKDSAERSSSLFDFSRDAENLTIDELAYRNSLLKPDEKRLTAQDMANFPNKPTPYFNREATAIGDMALSDDDRKAFISEAFDLLPDGQNSAVVKRIQDPAKSMPKIIDMAGTFYYVLKLTDDKPILKPSLQQYEEEKAKLLGKAIIDTRPIDDIRMDRFNQVKANFTRTGAEQKKQGED
jgi:hypothetical protein